jgi:cytoskeleton protein RodZ
VSRHRKRRATSPHLGAHPTHPHVGEKAGSRPAVDDDPGLLLRRARESKGLTIDDLSRATKVSRSVLTAIEAGDVAHLPATIYTRGFVKAYAREVGLNPDEMAITYLGHLEALAPPPAESGAPRSAAAPVQREVMQLHDDTAMILAGAQARRLGGLVTACSAIGLVVYVWSASRPPANTVSAPTESAAPLDVEPAAPARAAELDAVRADTEALEAMSGPLQIELRASADCWVIVTIDGQQVLAKLLQTGDQRTFTANNELLLRVGDPGALTYSINGRAGRPLGRAREPVDVRFTRDNIRDFIQS